MTYRLPLSKRQRLAEDKRWLYRTNPEYRLACINKERARRGLPPMQDVSQLPPLAPMPCPQEHRERLYVPARDRLGRFA